MKRGVINTDTMIRHEDQVTRYAVVVESRVGLWQRLRHWLGRFFS